MCTAIKDRLSPPTKLAYGAGDFCFSYMVTTLSVLFAIFLVNVVGLQPLVRVLYNAPGHKLRFLYRHRGAICDREGYRFTGWL